MRVKSVSEVAQSCLTLRDPMDCSPPGSSVRGIFQARALEGVPLPSPVTERRPLVFQGQGNFCIGNTRAATCPRAKTWGTGSRAELRAKSDRN